MLAATTLVTVAATFAAACNATSQVIAFVMRYDCSAGAGDKTETNASVSLAYDIKRYNSYLQVSSSLSSNPAPVV